MAKKMVDCERCNGTGQIPEYAHIADGRCFKCGGSGKVAARRPSSKKSTRYIVPQEDRDLANQWFKECVINNPLVWASPLMRNARELSDPSMKAMDTYRFHEAFGWGAQGMAEAEARMR